MIHVLHIYSEIPSIHDANLPSDRQQGMHCLVLPMILLRNVRICIPTLYNFFCRYASPTNN